MIQAAEWMFNAEKTSGAKFTKPSISQMIHDCYKSGEDFTRQIMKRV